VQILPDPTQKGDCFLYQYRAKYEIKNKAQLLTWLERYNQVSEGGGGQQQQMCMGMIIY
jgi:hypothetical protein